MKSLDTEVMSHNYYTFKYLLKNISLIQFTLIIIITIIIIINHNNNNNIYIAINHNNNHYNNHA